MTGTDYDGSDGFSKVQLEVGRQGASGISRRMPSARAGPFRVSLLLSGSRVRSREDVAEPLSKRHMLAGAIGNLLEWFDFASYGFFASVIGARFFPSDDETVSLLAAFGVFASGFIARPIGAVFFGHLGDRRGREIVLRWSALLMGSATFLMGTLPTYDGIGIAAPVLLTLLRILQGFSVGGEFTGSIIYLVENAAPQRRSFIGSLAFVSAFAGMLLGSAVGAVINALLTPEQVGAWGWRLPFLAGIGIMAVVAAFRRRLRPAGASASRDGLPVVMAFRTEWRAMLSQPSS